MMIEYKLIYASAISFDMVYCVCNDDFLKTDLLEYNFVAIQLVPTSSMAT